MCFIFYPANQTVHATLGRGRRPAPTNRSRQQLQREKALQVAAKQKEDAGSLPPEQQLTKPPDLPPVSHSALLKSQEQSKVMESELVQHELVKHEPVKHEPEEPEAVALPTVAIKELDKQEVELLVSLFLLQTWAKLHVLIMNNENE